MQFMFQLFDDPSMSIVLLSTARNYLYMTVHCTYSVQSTSSYSEPSLSSSHWATCQQYLHKNSTPAIWKQNRLSSRKPTTTRPTRPTWAQFPPPLWCLIVAQSYHEDQDLLRAILKMRVNVSDWLETSGKEHGEDRQGREFKMFHTNLYF